MMLSSDDCRNIHCDLLSLPTEIRCHIYDYLLADSQAITISAAYITVFGHRIQDRARKTDIPGLPLELTPLIRCHRDDSLFSVQDPPTIAIDDAPLQIIDAGPLVYPAPLALLQTCHLINAELTDYKNMKSKKQPAQARPHPSRAQLHKNEGGGEGLSLFVSYPYGVLVLKSMYPFLLKQARNVYISGYYTEPPAPTSPAVNESFNDRLTPSSSFTITKSFRTPVPSVPYTARSILPLPSTTANPPPITSQCTRFRLNNSQSGEWNPPSSIYPPYPPDTAHHAPQTLARLFRTLFSSTATQPIEAVARILYPGENTYRHVYGSNDSPIVQMLRSIDGGDIAMLVRRGNAGTAMCFKACPKPEGRCVSTCWENWSSGRAGGRDKAMDEFLRQIG